MMMLYRLVRMIETHSPALSACLLDRVKASKATPDYDKVPREELKDNVYEIYRHLGDWLITKNEGELERRYLTIGARRAFQGVPLSQVVWVIILTKENLWEFIKKEMTIERSIEVLGEMEMLQMLDQFFERAIYHAAIGHERATVEQSIAEATGASRTA